MHKIEVMGGDVDHVVSSAGEQEQSGASGK